MNNDIDVEELKRRAAAGDKKAAWEYSKLEAARCTVEFQNKLEKLSPMEVIKLLRKEISRISKGK